MNVRDHYRITKPGIIYGNLFVAVAAFFLGSGWSFDLVTLLGLVVGLSCIIAAAGALNNYFDRDIDAVMERTKWRVVVGNRLGWRQVMLYGVKLAVLGTLVLGLFVNPLALLAALFGLFAYLVFYTLLYKRTSHFGTLVGAVPGAMPPVVGYTAATGHLDQTALVLFFILVFWQMPHAYAIALKRIDDYRAARIPVLPIAKGIARTRLEMFFYTALFALTAPLLFTIGATGRIYFVVAITLGIGWTLVALSGFFTTTTTTTKNTTSWGRRMFLTSLLALMTLFLTMALDTVVI